jgi:hypothetical protein
MDLNLLVGLVFSLLITLSVVAGVAGVILLKPVSRHLGEFLEAKAEERRALGGRGLEEMRRLFETLERLEGRMELLEERQDFTERLLKGPRTGDPQKPGDEGGDTGHRE